MRRMLVPAVAALLLAVSTSYGHFMPPTLAPIDRLISNTQAYIKEHPKDASGYYTLARIHYMALAQKQEMASVYERGNPPAADAAVLPPLANDMMQGMGQEGNAVVPTDEQLSAHALAAVENFKKSIELDPNNALYHLGLASVLDQSADTPAAAAALAKAAAGNAATADHAELYKGLRADNYKDRTLAADKLRAMLPGIGNDLIKQAGVETDAEAKKLLLSLVGDVARLQALEEYAKAFGLAVDKDVKIRNKPLRGLNSLVSYEAATRYAELTKNMPANGDAKLAGKMADAKKTLEGKPMGPVTPIVFSMTPGKALPELLTAGTTGFDLDGTARGFQWPWVKGDTSILAWDPKHTGRITSGMQLFGSVTFNIFWEDGYRALDALDDNRDGVLSGEELRGLVIWRDANGNGVSDPGEVTPIEQTPVAKIAVRADTTASPDAAPCATRGITLKDGAVLPTWDWISVPRGEDN